MTRKQDFLGDCLFWCFVVGSVAVSSAKDRVRKGIQFLKRQYFAGRFRRQKPVDDHKKEDVFIDSFEDFAEWGLGSEDEFYGDM